MVVDIFYRKLFLSFVFTNGVSCDLFYVHRVLGSRHKKCLTTLPGCISPIFSRSCSISPVFGNVRWNSGSDHFPKLTPLFMGDITGSFFGKSSIVDAVKISDSTKVKLLLEEGADPNEFDEWGVSCLQLSVKKGDENVVALLLKHGANVHVSTSDGEMTTPLHTAARFGNLGVIDILLRFEADVDRKDAFGCTALKVASEYKKFNVVSRLQSLTSTVGANDPIDLKGVDLGSQSLTKEEADFLLEENADWEAADSGEEGGGGSVIEVVTDPSTGLKTLRRVPLKSDFIKQLERRRRAES